MSEPTYRVELTHHPENGKHVEWQASVHNILDDGGEYWTSMFDAFRATRGDAFDAAQAWCKAKAQEPSQPSTEYLDEDGNRWEGSLRVLETEPRNLSEKMYGRPDPHEVQR